MYKLLELLKKNKLFIALIIIIGTLTFFIYKSFVIKPPIKDNELYIRNSVELKSDDLDNNKMIIIDALQKKKINLTIKNNFNNNKKVYVWYKVEDIEKVKVGNLSSSKIKLSREGLIIKGTESYEIEIGVKNSLYNPTTIEFGIVCTDEFEELDNTNNYLFVDEVFKINNQKVFAIGDKVTLKDNSSWHVIEESASSDIYVLLLKDDTIKIDGNTTNINAKNNMVLHETSDEKISFYLDNEYRNVLEGNNIQIGEEGEIRLITLNELQVIGQYEYKDYNYYAKNSPKWLIINSPWWTMTPFSNDSYYYVNGGDIMSIKNVKKVRASIRPVVKLLKSNIK